MDGGQINEFTFEGVKLCACCKVEKPLRLHFCPSCENCPFGFFEFRVPNTDQETGIVGSEPNDTLSPIRSDEVLRPNLKQQKRIYFGKHQVCKDNLIAQGNGKMIKVGDPVYILRKVSSVAEAAV